MQIPTFYCDKYHLADRVATTLKHIIIACLLLCLSLPSVCNAQFEAPAFAEAKAKGQAKIICPYANLSSFIEKNKYGELEGICVDLIEAFQQYVVQQENIQLEIEYQDLGYLMNFDGFLREVGGSKGGVFGLGNITVTPERGTFLDFSTPYLNNITVLVTHASVADLQKLSMMEQEFKNMRAYTSRGTTSYEHIQKIKQAHFPSLPVIYIPATDFEQLIISNGFSVFKDRKALVYVDFIYFFNLIKKGVNVKRHPEADIFGEQFGLIMPKNSDWTPVMNRFMEGYLKSEDYKESIRRHFNSRAVNALAVIH